MGLGENKKKHYVCFTSGEISVSTHGGKERSWQKEFFMRNASKHKGRRVGGKRLRRRRMNNNEKSKHRLQKL